MSETEITSYTYEVDRASKPGDRKRTLEAIKAWIDAHNDDDLAGIFFLAIHPDHDTTSLYLSGNEVELREFANDFLSDGMAVLR